MAEAILTVDSDAKARGEPCRFCGSEPHKDNCPVALAERVMRQARLQADP